MRAMFKSCIATLIITVGLCPGTAFSQRATDGLMALYGFQEGGGASVMDVSGQAPALNLTIANPALVTWLPGGGLSLASGARLATPGAATKIINGAMATGELTVEAWIKPANVTQDGPARIVTLSGGGSASDFTLGQAPYPAPIDAFVLRLRTTVTDAVGQPALASAAGTATTNLTHLVCTRDNAGNRRMYINGVAAANDVSGGTFAGWNTGFRLLVGNEEGDERPWAGVVRLVAAYNRDLSATEVARNFAAGPTLGGVGTVTTGDVIIAGLQSWNNPTGQDPGEMVELFNTTSRPISLAGMQLISRVDNNSDGVLDVDWQLSADLTGAVIAPYSFYLIAEAGVDAASGVIDLAAVLDLATGEGGSAERATSLQLVIDNIHMDYVVYGRHDGQTPAGETPPGDLPFNGSSWPRAEVIRNTTGDANFQEGLFRRETMEALFAGHDALGYYTDEDALGDGFPNGIWTCLHDEIFGAYEARNSVSPQVLPPVPDAYAFAVITDLHSSAYQANVEVNLQQIKQWLDNPTPDMPAPAFAVVTGDFPNWNQTQAAFDNVLGAGFPWYPVMGNHEVSDNINNFLYVRDVMVPALPGIDDHGPVGSLNSTYSFDHENAHFVVLNGYWNGGTGAGADYAADGNIVPELRSWLVANLATDESEHTYVFVHEPAYPDDRHVGDALDQYPANRDAFVSALDAAGVQALFCGHTHYYDHYTSANAPLLGGVHQVTNAAMRNLTEQDGASITYVKITGGTAEYRVYRSMSGAPFALAETWSVDESGSGPVNYALAVTTIGGGSVALDPPGGVYPVGTMVQLTATAAENWTFDHWSGHLTGSANPAYVTVTGNLSVAAHFTGGSTGACDDFNAGYIAGTQLRDHADWFYEAANTGPAVLATGGVAGSVGLGNGGAGFAWVAHPFQWSDPTLVGTWMQLDFQTSATGVFDDDRVGWTTSNTDDSSDWHFGVQMDPGGTGAGGNIECYWDGPVQGDDQGRASIANLPALTASAWYRLRADFTKLTSTSCRIDVTLTALDAAGNESVVVASGTLADSSLLPGGAGQAAPPAYYFTAANLWPMFKNHSGAAGNCDNACFGVTTGTSPDFNLTVNVVGSGAVTLDPPGGVYDAGTTVELTATATAGNRFLGWSGDLQGTANPTSLVMTGHRAVTATFGPAGTLATGDVIIAALQAWNTPTGQNPGEMVELFNTTDHPIPLAGLQLVSRVDNDSDGVVEIDWQAALDTGGAVIAPYGFYLIGESGVDGENGVIDLVSDLDLATGEGGAAERAISLELQLSGLHMDYVVYGRHDGSTPAGELPPGDRPFNGVSWPRTEVVRNTTGEDSFRDGLLRRESAADLHAGFDVEGFYTDENLLGDGYPAGVWTSPHEETYGSYLGRNSTSAPVPPGGNRPPQMPVLVGPVDGTTDVARDPQLRVTVSDPDLDELQVTFYGRELIDAQADNFTFVLLPDTQNYSQYYPQHFLAQTQWIAANRQARNIAFVAHEGDIVNNAASSGEWANANAAMSVLENPLLTGLPGGIPFSVLPGNHDQPTTLYNQHFSVTRFSGRPYYGGNYGTTNDSNYALFSAGGLDFLVVNLEMNPPAGALAWADGVLKAYPGRRAILLSHNLLNADGSWGGPGLGIYNELKDNPNLFLMLCGHVHAENERVDVFNGNTIRTVLADYQDLPEGGTGWLRLLEFQPALNRVRVLTYSPVLDAYGTDTVRGYDQTAAEFFLSCDLSDTGDYQVIGTAGAVASGGEAAVTWTGLEYPDRSYQWYVEIFDGFATTTGPVWTFTTDHSSAVDGVPDAFYVARNYPNPFNPRTTIAFGLPASGSVEVGVYDLMGRRLVLLGSGTFPAGRHEVVWDGRDAHGRNVPTGTYIYRVRSAQGDATGKMVLLK